MSQIPAHQHAIQIVGVDEIVINDSKPVDEVGPHQLLLQVEACGICFSDTKLLHAFDSHPRKAEVVEGIAPEALAEIPSYKPGTQVTVLQKGHTWSRVQVDGKVGFMSTAYLNFGGSSSGNQGTHVGKVAVVNNPKATQVLNLRETASLDARVLSYYRNGAKVTILSNNGTWYKVKTADGKLEITKTENGVNPLCKDQTALLGCDVWEHSYYIDFRNKRPAYLTNFLEKLVNWEAVAAGL